LQKEGAQFGVVHAEDLLFQLGKFDAGSVSV